MKRLSIIFNVALLSLLIIIVGGGVTLMHCNHTGSLSVVQLPGAAVMSHEMDDEAETEGNGEMDSDCHCCHFHNMIGELPCMNYKLLSCQPSIMSHGFSFSHVPVCVQLPDFLSSAVSPYCIPAARRKQTECSGRHGPPRHYLRLITVLQI